MTSPAMRARYLNDSIATASPARLLVMLYERLVVDLVQAETALGNGERETADDRLKLVEPLLDAWRQASMISAAPAA
jgi:flagellar protein FliS